MGRKEGSVYGESAGRQELLEELMEAFFKLLYYHFKKLGKGDHQLRVRIVA